ncbi:hypothetical protein [Aquimonas voraii]|uniref:Uncharacterized protein n=1 Tax=Aquimonas voraii TaxID=265719 RepID=A0A1G7AGE0_9GAMM|nr:hypothetical protein [Aquimonas voraii]SDE13891.1 hypothetical protein SAMN04488509_1269 [Aquimonas voraii]
MLFELIAVIASGFCLAGLALTLRWLLRGRLPTWLVPAAAGLGMLSYSVWSEYSWLERARSTLPVTAEVVSTNEVRAWYRPWTYVVPQVNRLIAIDRAELKRNPAQPGKVLAGVLLMGRWEPTRKIGVMFDCVEAKRADLLDGVQFDDSGALQGAHWIDLAAGDPLLAVACREDSAG